MDYESQVRVESKTAPGVSFTIARMSFGRRLELTRRVRDIATRVEFLEAGKDPREKLEAALLAGEIDRVYLDWGLVKVDGLVLDGEPATPSRMIELGSEELTQEILAAIKAQCGLNAEERKN
jgi:hypothetical protein